MRKLHRLLLLIMLLPGICRGEALLLDEITVRGQEESPQQETLTIREVRESSARDMGEALELLPGFTSVTKGVIANDVVLRGLQGDDINVFLDGVRLYGGCPSRMDPPSFHFDFAEVDSIEIIKGPYDLYNAGSMGGVVNAVSKTPPAGSSATFTGSYGSYRLVNLSASGSYATEKSYLLAGYAYKSSDVTKSGNGRLITDIYSLTSPNRYKPEFLNSGAYQINTFWTKGGTTLGPSRFSLNYSYQDAEAVLYPYLLMDAEYDRTNRINFTSTTRITGSALEELNFQAWWNQVDHLMNDRFRVSSTPSMMVTRALMMETDSTTRVYGAKLSSKVAAGGGLLELGIDYYNRNWDATNISAMWLRYQPQPLLPDVDADNFGAFSKYSRPLGDKIKLTAGTRIDFTAVEANDLTAARLSSLYQPYHRGSLSRSTDFTAVSGNLQLSWLPTTGIEIFTGFGSGVRTPDAQELFIGLQRSATNPTSINWVGNPALDASRNNQIDVGLKFSGDNYYLNSSLFYSLLDNFIYLQEVADPDGAGPLVRARTYRNIAAEMYGGELAGQYALSLDLYLRGTLSYVRGKNSASGSPLAEIPPLTGSASIRYDIGSFFFEFSERFAAEQDRVDRDLSEIKSAGWGATDLKTGVNWGKWSATGGISNLFDKQYLTHLSYQRDAFSSGVKVPEPGRLAYVMLAYRY
jgi:iron complex outermembrane receptor protein